ncbi:hypothetical protein LTR08_007939 [Meristemomyces frigidus]|nr:hypothetical protein LTR08_007939 [Meristemomyces frigidus]
MPKVPTANSSRVVSATLQGTAPFDTCHSKRPGISPGDPTAEERSTQSTTNAKLQDMAPVAFSNMSPTVDQNELGTAPEQLPTASTDAETQLRTQVEYESRRAAVRGPEVLGPGQVAETVTVVERLEELLRTNQAEVSKWVAGRMLQGFNTG